MNGVSIHLAVFLAAFVVAGLVVAGQGAAQTPAPAQPAPPPAASRAAKPAPSHSAAAKPATPTARPGKTPVVTAPANAHAQKVPPPSAAKPGAAAGDAGATAPAGPPPPGRTGPEPPKVGASGLPLPRWASLRAEEVNLRSGPGTRYPIEWVYHRRDLPVQIEREFEGWRLIEDLDGVKGWVHQATLTGRRSFVVTGGEHTLRRSASEDASPVALLKPGVVGRLRPCEAHAAWCEVQVGDYRGYLKRAELYGLYPDEAVN